MSNRNFSDYKLIRLARCSSQDGFIQEYCLYKDEKERMIKIRIILNEIKEYSNKFKSLELDEQQEIINKIKSNHPNDYDLCDKIFLILKNDPKDYNPVKYGLSNKPILTNDK